VVVPFLTAASGVPLPAGGYVHHSSHVCVQTSDSSVCVLGQGGSSVHHRVARCLYMTYLCCFS
jgi:hypothetical protein